MFGTVVTAALAQDNTWLSRRTREGGRGTHRQTANDPYAKKISRAIKWTLGNTNTTSVYDPQVRN